MSVHQEQILTIILSPIALVTGWFGLHLTDVDLLMAIVLKGMSIISLILIIAINWDGGISRIKKALKKGK